jgi:putative ATP-dependent endonuclease of the OLD family
MRVIEIEYRRFRGFRKLRMNPRGHVLLVGEPRAGRSDALEGLARVLGGGGGRLPDPDELDFHKRDTTARAEVEVVLGDLRPALEQLFFDQLEFWDTEEGELIDELDMPEDLDGESVLTVVRLCYRIEWDEEEALGRHWVDFPKNSDPGAGIFRRLSRAEREAIPFVGWTASGRVLSLAPRSSFRELVEQAEGDGLADALDDLVEQLESLGAGLASVDQVSNALEAVLAPWRDGLGNGSTSASEIVSFLPEGGAIAAILRSLAPALDLPNAPALPLARHGSTTQSLALHGQLVTRASEAGIVALDDFGDRLDAASARHSAALLRRLPVNSGSPHGFRRSPKRSRLRKSCDSAQPAQADAAATSRTTRPRHARTRPATTADPIRSNREPQTAATLAPLPDPSSRHRHVLKTAERGENRCRPVATGCRGRPALLRLFGVTQKPRAGWLIARAPART